MPSTITPELRNRLRSLAVLHAELRQCGSTQGLFARAAEVVRLEGAFERALVLSVNGRQLTALDTAALGHDGSDQLRRRVLAEPVGLVRGTEEAELVRRGSAALHRGPGRRRSVLAQQLELREHAYGPVVADGRTIALLVADRARAIDEGDLLWLDLFAAMLAVALNDVVVRARVATLSAELRAFTASAVALVREATEGAVTLPSNRGAVPTSPWIGLDRSASHAEPLFSDRERRVAELLVEGLTNRQIAAELVVSPETVKTHVARILRKLGARNRAEAVAVFLGLNRS